MKKYLVYILCVLVFSCKKNDISSNTNNGGGGNGGGGVSSSLSSFSVSVIERKFGRAIIQWTECKNTNTADTVKYNVTLNNYIVDSNLTLKTDTFYNVFYDSTYYGSVTAYTKTGLTKTENFILEKLNGKYYSTRGSALSCNKIFSDGVNNTVLWQKNINSLETTPTLSNDTVFLAGGYANQGYFTAMNSNNGSLYWSVSPGYSIFNQTSITYFQGNLYASTDSGVVCLNSRTGSMLWKYLRPNPSSTNYLKTNPVIANNKIFVGTKGNSGVLMALNLSNGNPLWEFQLNGQLCSTPFAYNNLIIFTAGNNVIALDQNSGSLIWQKNDFGQSSNSPILIGNSVIVCIGGYISALDVNTGNLLWRKYYSNSPDGFSSLAVGGEKVFFSSYIRTDQNTYKGKIIAIDIKNGNLVWELLTFTENLTNLIYAKNSIYSGGGGYLGRIWRLNALSGNIEGVESFYSQNFSLTVNNKPYYNHENGNYKLSD